jgi:cytochrome c-type biogenesis protein CcmE
MTDAAPPVADLDLTPRGPAPTRSGRRWGFIVVVVLLFCVAGIVLWKGLSDAATFFYNADEAVERKDQLGDDNFRLQGTVVPDSLVDAGVELEFDVTYNGVVVPVHHSGAPPDLFQEGMPVVLEGHWDADVFASDEILVRHDEVYVEENEDRLRDAEEGGTTPSDEADPADS